MKFDALALRATEADSSEIVRWIEAKAPRAIGNWNEIGGEEYARAFAVAGTAGHDVIGDIYSGMLDTIREGGTEEDFAARVTPILREKGWLAGTGQSIGTRVALIYDTNLRVARGVGRWQRVQDVAHVMPYLVGKTVGDERVRGAHRHFEGVVLPVTDGFWQEFWPPLYFRCRCDVIQLSRGQFARRGHVLTSDAEAERRAALIRPQSWGYNVALAGSKPLQETVEAANERGVPGTPPLSEAGMSDAGRSRWGALAGLAVAKLLEGLASALA